MIAPPGIEPEKVRVSVLVPKQPDFFEFILGALAAMAREGYWEASENVETWDIAEVMSQVVASFRIGAVSEVGTFVYSITELSPDKYIICQGQSLPMADWPELMEVYPAVLKNYPSAGLFYVPNGQGRVLVGDGVDASGYNWAFLAQGGERVHTLTEAEMPTHAHAYTGVVVTPTVGGEIPATASLVTQVPANTGASGGGLAHNNMPPYGVVHMYLVGKP